MLLRAVGRQMSAVIRQKTAVRSIAMSRVALGGGHHHEPQPVYIPKPGSLDWTFFGSGSKPNYEFEPYKPEIGSFIGAFVFIGLTAAAVLFKTDTFKKEDTHHHKHAHKADAHHEEHEEHVEPEPEPVQEEASPAATEEEAPAPTTSEPDASEPAATTSTESAETPKKTESEEPTPSTSSEEKSGDQPTTSEAKEEKALHCEYVIIGSGTAAYYASLAIRAKQAEAKVLMIGEETELPYNRPPLSKELWWYGDESATTKLDYTSLSGRKRDIFYEVEGFFVAPDELSKATHGGVSLLRGKKATKICPEDKKVVLEDGTTIGYEKILIATGVRPKREKVFDEASEEARAKITYYHYPADFQRVERSLADKSTQKVTIIGNGLLASELSYSIHRKYPDVEVHQIFEENHVAEDILPKHLAQKSTEAIRTTGIDVRPNEKVQSVRKCCKNVVLKLKDGSELRTDLIVVATGDEPNSELGEASGLKLDAKLGGVEADRHLKVTENVWAAGAVVSFDDVILGKRRINSWEHAQVSGRLAGENMVTHGQSEKAFWFQPSFFTKFAPKLHISAIGQCDSSLETVSVYAEPSAEDPLDKAVVFYKSKNDGTVVGVLLVNVFGPSLDVARRLIDDKKQVDEFKEIAKLFPLYFPPKQDEEEDKTKSP